MSAVECILSADAPEAEMIWLEVTASEKISIGWAVQFHKLCS